MAEGNDSAKTNKPKKSYSNRGRKNTKNTRSGADYVDVAYQFHLLTLQICKKVTKNNKSYTFYLGVPIAQSAKNAHGYAASANSIFPVVTKGDAAMRRKYLQMARAAASEVADNISIVHDVYDLGSDEMFEWSRITDRLITLLSKTIASEQKRYQDLPDF